MNNLVIFFVVCSALLVAFLVGAGGDGRAVKNPPPPVAAEDMNIPHIGSIEILNGCGSSGAGRKAAAFLREKKFDVKIVGNAPTWNYPFTLVASRTSNMDIANQVAKVLKTDKIILLRNGSAEYDITVYLGADYRERIQ
jgi:hypothetical protein